MVSLSNMALRKLIAKRVKGESSDPKDVPSPGPTHFPTPGTKKHMHNSRSLNYGHKARWTMIRS